MKRKARNWRSALTQAEADELAPIEREMAALRNRLSWLSWRYHSIQNRASVRAGKSKSDGR